MAEYDALLTPFTLKHLTIRNRIMSTAHAPAYAEDGMPRERYQLYHEEKAKGGLALTMFGGSSNVAPDSLFSRPRGPTGRIRLLVATPCGRMCHPATAPDARLARCD